MFVASTRFFMAKFRVAGSPAWWRAVLLWVLIQLGGAVLFIVVLTNLPAPPTNNPSGNDPLGDAGYGVVIFWIMQWVLTHGFRYALPLLVLLPLGIGLALKHPAYRTRKLLGVVLGLELGVVAGEAWELSAHPAVFFGEISWGQALPIIALVASPYILTALLLAWLLYRPWLRKPALQQLA